MTSNCCISFTLLVEMKRFNSSSGSQIDMNCVRQINMVYDFFIRWYNNQHVFQQYVTIDLRNRTSHFVSVQFCSETITHKKVESCTIKCYHFHSSRFLLKNGLNINCHSMKLLYCNLQLIQCMVGDSQMLVILMTYRRSLTKPWQTLLVILILHPPKLMFQIHVIHVIGLLDWYYSHFGSIHT